MFKIGHNPGPGTYSSIGINGNGQYFNSKFKSNVGPSIRKSLHVTRTSKFTSVKLKPIIEDGDKLTPGPGHYDGS